MEPYQFVTIVIAICGFGAIYFFRSPKESHSELRQDVDALRKDHNLLSKEVAGHHPLMHERTQSLDRSVQGLTLSINLLRESIQEQISQLRKEIHGMRSK